MPNLTGCIFRRRIQENIAVRMNAMIRNHRGRLIRRKGNTTAVVQTADQDAIGNLGNTPEPLRQVVSVPVFRSRGRFPDRRPRRRNGHQKTPSGLPMNSTPWACVQEPAAAIVVLNR